MKVENTYDEVMFAALAGLTPDSEDLAGVRVPAGEDETEFRASVRTRAQQIAVLRGQGNNGEARRLADEGSSAYLRHFDELTPVPARGGADADLSISELGARMFRR